MKAILVLTMLAATVRLDLELDNEIGKISNDLFFVRHFIGGVFTTNNLAKKCLVIDVNPPSAFKFSGSKFLFKLLRLAYFNDLTHEPTEASAPNSVYKLALAAAQSYQCNIAQDEIYKQVIKKFSNPCVVPDIKEVHFKESDLRNIAGYSNTCPQKLNSIVNSIIDGFNDITSEEQKYFERYIDGLNLLFFAYANEYKKKISNETNLKLMFLLLNEFLLSGVNKFGYRGLENKISRLSDDMNTSLGKVSTKMGYLTDIDTEDKVDFLKHLMFLKNFVFNNLLGETLEGEKQRDIQELLESFIQNHKKRVI